MDSHSHESHADHDHGHSHEGQAPKLLLKAIGITLLFMTIELAGGWYANSLALISDGAHMLTDVAAMLLSIFAVWVARKPADSKMSFGYHRAEILGALASGLMIWLIAGFLIYQSILRMQSPPEVQGPVVFVIATIGLIANLACMRLLHPASAHNMNLRGAYLHMLSDTLGSVGAIIAGAILWFTHWNPIDPIVTILFAALMLFTSWDLVREAVQILMESTPPGVNPEKVMSDLKKIDGIQEVHDLHIWTVSSGKLALSVHLVSEHGNEVLSRTHHLLQEHYGIVHTTIQIEHPEHFQPVRCYDCE